MVRGLKEIELNDRDRFVLYLLDKFRVLDAKSVVVMASFSSESYAAIRLQKLARYGYIKRERIVTSLPLVHYLTSKGNDEINDIRRRQIKPRIGTLEHELAVGRVASYLTLNKGIEPISMITDRDMRAYESQINDNRVMSRKGDIVFLCPKTNKKVLVEVELTFKGVSRTKENIRKNKRISDEQLWFYPKHKKVLEKVLKEQNIDNRFYLEDLSIIPANQMIDYLFQDIDRFENIESYFINNFIEQQGEGGVLDKWTTI